MHVASRKSSNYEKLNTNEPEKFNLINTFNWNCIESTGEA
jgi:hypothetical protein